MATSVNYDMDQGATFSFTFVVKNDDGTPKNIKYDYSMYCQMRKHYTSANSVTLTASKVDDGEFGEIKISLTASQTAEIKPGVYFYDVELIGLNTNTDLEERGVIRRVQQGMITVYPEISKF